MPQLHQLPAVVVLLGLFCRLNYVLTPECTSSIIFINTAVQANFSTITWIIQRMNKTVFIIFVSKFEPLNYLYGNALKRESKTELKQMNFKKVIVKILRRELEGSEMRTESSLCMNLNFLLFFVLSRSFIECF